MAGSADLIKYHLNELKPWVKWLVICTFLLIMGLILVRAIGIDINKVLDQKNYERSII